jgi:hypothetical protein
MKRCQVSAACLKNVTSTGEMCGSSGASFWTTLIKSDDSHSCPSIVPVSNVTEDPRRKFGSSMIFLIFYHSYC